MSDTALNDTKYNFKPLQVFVPSKDYKVDEVELQKSIEKSKAIFDRLKEKKSKK